MKRDPFDHTKVGKMSPPWRGQIHQIPDEAPPDAVDIVRDLAKAEIWTYDGRFFPAPSFQIGIFPAGSLYTQSTTIK